MLWLYNNNLNQNGIYEFYQIFTEYNLVYNDETQNNIYSFSTTDSQKFKFNLDNYKFDDVICEIKMIDHIISYNILNKDLNKKQCVFTYKMNFIEPNDNHYKIPIFKYVYKSTNEKRLPNLIETEYDFSSILDFKIYKLDNLENNIQFVVETNPLTKLTRNYFITTNLSFIDKYV